MRIVIEGCMHGELDHVYSTLLHMEKVENKKIDLLICCGDFQSIRNTNDLQSLNVPPKYKKMGSFWKYYSGQALAPFPTIFIGGNHEASSYLWELYYGGWAAPNIYFMGFAGVIKFGNLRIGGLSGIYKDIDYTLGHHERYPYSSKDVRSVYHTREYEVQKLRQVTEPIDIFISHDWPCGIARYGNLDELLLVKPSDKFRNDILNNSLGSPPAEILLNELKPKFWFSAHHHCKFAALVQHGYKGPITRFLALGKCLPGHDFLQAIDIIEDGPKVGPPYEIHYDEEWLAITKKFNSVLPLTREPAKFGLLKFDKKSIEEHREWVINKLEKRGTRKPFEFVQTVPPYCPSVSRSVVSRSSDSSHPGINIRNPQTESLMQFLELPYIL